MTWWEWVSAFLTAGGVVVSIFGAWITYAARWNGERTRELARALHRDTLAVLERMEARAVEGQQAMEARLLQTLDRIDQRAAERHRFER